MCSTHSMDYNPQRTTLVPTRRGGSRNFIPLFHTSRILQSLLSNNPLPTKICRICHERSNLKPPPVCHIKEELIRFSKEDVKLCLALPCDSMCTQTCAIQPEHAIPCIWSLLNMHKILQLERGFRGSTHEFCTKLPNLKSLKLRTLATCLGKTFFWNLYRPTHSYEVG